MESSFLLLSCAVNKNTDVASQLSQLSGIKEAIPVSGVYDCIVKTEPMSTDYLKELVLSHIRPMNGIHSVLTLNHVPQIIQN